MISTDGFILMTLAVMTVTFCIMFVWLCIINKTLDLMRHSIHKMEDVLWHMQSLLSVQDVDAARLTEDGKTRLIMRKLNE